MELITKAMLQGKFNLWLRAIGGRRAKDYNDIGGYRIQANSPGDGKTCYSIEQIINSGGGVRPMLHSVGAADFWYKMDAGCQTIHELGHAKVA